MTLSPWKCGWLASVVIAVAGCNSAVVETDETRVEIAVDAELEVLAFWRAELVNGRAIHLIHPSGLAPTSHQDLRLTDHAGNEIAITHLSYDTSRRTLVVPDGDVDIRKVHYLDILSEKRRIRVRFDGWFRTLYSDRRLGAEVNIETGTTQFGLFAPRADAVTLYLYDRPDAAPAEALQTIALENDGSGVWFAELSGDLKGAYYDFVVKGVSSPGSNALALETHLSDPYARVNVGAMGKSRVWYKQEPAAARPSGALAMEDVVAYEVHVQDFTDQLPEDAKRLGPLRAMIEPGLTNQSGQPIGFDYLTSLGINTVHLMPVQEYLHHPDEAWAEAFSEDPRMQALGIAKENYQWGYRTTHAFAIERRYGTPGLEPGNERAAFRELVDAFHAKDIAVIIDIVPNHTGENMDGAERLINFNGIDKAYYYRTDDEVEHIGPFGNEVKTEDRPMVQRWIIDQCVSLVEEFGIDGFRIDLAGQIDEQTLIALKEALGPDILIYGEPWIDVTDPYIRANPDWDWYKEDSPITFFQDEARNAFKGSPFVLENKQTDRGYAGGNADLREEVMKALANDYADESTSPNQGLNYLDIHDNWALADRFAAQNWNGLQGIDEASYRVAAGLLMTSMGPIVIHGGSEIMRSKGLAPVEEWHVETGFGDIYFKGRDDTYNLRTPNQFVWETVGKAGGEGTPDFADMQDWWSGLIAFRLSEAGRVFRKGDAVPAGYYDWILPEDPALLGYVVDERVLVLVNVGPKDANVDADVLPDGLWRQIADGKRVDLSGLSVPSLMTDTLLPAKSLSIWQKSPN